MSIDIESPASQSEESYHDIADKLAVTLEVAIQEKQAAVFHRLKERVRNLRDALQAAMEEQLGEDEAFENTEFDQLFADVAAFLKPKEVRGRPFARTMRRGGLKADENGGTLSPRK